MTYIRIRSRMIGVAASVLAIAAITGPVASARPNLEPQTTVQVSSTAGPPPVVQRSEASELAAIDRLKAQVPIHHAPANGRYSTAALTTAATPVATPTLTTPGNGFDWGDAAVGAGVVAAIGLLIAAASVAVRHRSEPRHP